MKSKSACSFKKYFMSVGWDIQTILSCGKDQISIISNNDEMYLAYEFKNNVENIDCSSALKAMKHLQGLKQKTRQMIIVGDSFNSNCNSLKEFNFIFYDNNKIKNLNRIKKGIPNYKHIQLQAHNDIAFECFMKSTENKNAFRRATGTGKGFLIGRITQEFHGKKILVVAPTRFIIDQQKMVSGKIENVNYLTYAKLNNLKEDDEAIRDLDIIFLDEFHRAGALLWNKSVVRLMRRSSSKTKFIGTTATPVRHLDNNRNMLEELFEGNEICPLELPDAIARGILNSPRYITGSYQIKEQVESIEKKISNGKYTESIKSELVETLNGLTVDWERFKGVPQLFCDSTFNFKGKHLVFCKNLEHLDLMKLQIVEWIKKAYLLRKGTRLPEDPNVFSIHSQIQSDENQKTLIKFESSVPHTLNLLFSVDMLNEGKHINHLDGVILHRNTISPIVFYQQIGRCFSVGNNKSPLIIDLVGNVSSLKAFNFEEEILRFSNLHKRKLKQFQLDESVTQGEIINFDEDFGEDLVRLSKKVSKDYSFEIDLETIEELRVYARKNDFLSSELNSGLSKKMIRLKKAYKRQTISQKLILVIEKYNLTRFFDIEEELMCFVKSNLKSNKIPTEKEHYKNYRHLWKSICRESERIDKKISKLTKINIQKLIKWGILECTAEAIIFNREKALFETLRRNMRGNQGVIERSKDNVAQALRILRDKFKNGELSSKGLNLIEEYQLMTLMDYKNERIGVIENNMRKIESWLNENGKLGDTIGRIRIKDGYLYNFLKKERSNIEKGIGKNTFHHPQLIEWGILELEKKLKITEKVVEEYIDEIYTRLIANENIVPDAKLYQKKRHVIKKFRANDLSDNCLNKLSEYNMIKWIEDHSRRDLKEGHLKDMSEFEAEFNRTGKLSLNQSLRNRNLNLYKRGVQIRYRINKNLCGLGVSDQKKLVHWGLMQDFSCEVHLITIEKALDYIKENNSLDLFSTNHKAAGNAINRLVKLFDKGELSNDVREKLKLLLPYFRSKNSINIKSTINYLINYQNKNGCLAGLRNHSAKHARRVTLLRKMFKENKLDRKYLKIIKKNGLQVFDNTRARKTIQLQIKTIKSLEQFVIENDNLKGIKKKNLPLNDQFSVLKSLYRSGKLKGEIVKMISKSEYLRASDFEFRKKKTNIAIINEISEYVSANGTLAYYHKSEGVSKYNQLRKIVTKFNAGALIHEEHDLVIERNLHMLF